MTDSASATQSQARRHTCPIARFTSRTSSRGDTFRSSDEPSKQATRSETSRSSVQASFRFFRLFCFFFFGGGFDSPPSVTGSKLLVKRPFMTL